MKKKILFLIGLGVLGLNTMAKANVFENEEYSHLQKYLKSDQQEAFEKVIGGNLNRIKNNGYILDKLELEENTNKDAISNIEQEIKELKAENKREIARLEKDFVKNPQRYNQNTIYAYSRIQEIKAKKTGCLNQMV